MAKVECKRRAYYWQENNKLASLKIFGKEFKLICANMHQKMAKLLPKKVSFTYVAFDFCSSCKAKICKQKYGLIILAKIALGEEACNFLLGLHSIHRK